MTALRASATHVAYRCDACGTEGVCPRVGLPDPARQGAWALPDGWRRREPTRLGDPLILEGRHATADDVRPEAHACGPCLAACEPGQDLATPFEAPAAAPALEVPAVTVAPVRRGRPPKPE